LNLLRKLIIEKDLVEREILSHFFVKAVGKLQIRFKKHSLQI